MTSPRCRRAVVSLALALGLVLMHGGIGQASACAATGGGPAMAMPTSTGSAASMHVVETAGEHAHHPSPDEHPADHSADQPVMAHTATCASTPALVGGGGGAGPPVVTELPRHVHTGAPIGLIAPVAALGREPPHFDLVADLCVVRI